VPIIEWSTQIINTRSYQFVKYQGSRINEERVGIYARKRISSRLAWPAWRRKKIIIRYYQSAKKSNLKACTRNRQLRDPQTLRQN